VTDGRSTYGLTSQHVTGLPGETLYTLNNKSEAELGVSCAKQIQKKALGRFSRASHHATP